MANTIKAVVKNRRDTAVDLSTDNLIPYEGEITFESDTLRFKVGDGVTPYNTLPYSSENSINGYVVENIADAVDVIETLPDATTYKGEYTVKRRGAGLGKVLFATASGQTINGNTASSWGLDGESGITLFPSDGNWEVKNLEGMITIIEDRKGSGVNAGTFTSGAWQPRDLNTFGGMNTNNIYGLSLVSNQVTLQPGRYAIYGTAPAFQVNSHKTRLRDITGSIDISGGTTEQTATADGVTTRSVINDIIDLSVVTLLEFQHRCDTTKATNGFGTNANYGVDEIYAKLRIEKIG